MSDARQGYGAPALSAAHTRSSARSAWEHDFDRIIFSHPFRRLQDKTQVHPLPEHDFVHTRLTHSLEVSSVGRTLGRLVGQAVTGRHPHLAQRLSAFDFGAVTAAASLAHDLGNPPFGHTGEDALSEFFRTNPVGRSYRERLTEWQWQDLTRFEGNAQGFRLLSRGRFGLRLTHATLGAFMKYPCPSTASLGSGSGKSRRKFGFFQTELESFQETAAMLGLTSREKNVHMRHPLAFLVEAADDICYSIIDLEDGCRLGLVTLDETLELFAPVLGASLDRAKLLRERSLNEKLGVLRAMTIGKLTDACAMVFVENERSILDGSFDEALVDAGPYRKDMEAVSKLSKERIYQARHVTEIEAAGFEILPGLLEVFVGAADAYVSGDRSKRADVHARLLPIEVLDDIRLAGDDVYSRLRLVLDFVSGLTDRHALSLYRKLKGISL